MTTLIDHITVYYRENGNIPVSPAEICSTLRGEGVEVYEDSIRRAMAKDVRFESITVEGKRWKRWRKRTIKIEGSYDGENWFETPVGISGEVCVNDVNILRTPNGVYDVSRLKVFQL